MRTVRRMVGSGSESERLSEHLESMEFGGGILQHRGTAQHSN